VKLTCATFKVCFIEWTVGIIARLRNRSAEIITIERQGHLSHLGVQSSSHVPQKTTLQPHSARSCPIEHRSGRLRSSWKLKILVQNDIFDNVVHRQEEYFTELWKWDFEDLESKYPTLH